MIERKRKPIKLALLTAVTVTVVFYLLITAVDGCAEFIKDVARINAGQEVSK